MDARVALITGAAGGIGGATVDRFVRDGWRVAATDIDPPDSPGGDVDGRSAVSWFRADLATVDGCRSAVAHAAATFGRIDCVVNAAGVWTEGPAESATESQWDRVIDLNLKGLFFVCSAAIPHLVASEGSIVNVSSDAGVQGNAGASIYCASKGGVTVMSKALALELAPHRVRVNAVCPGDVDTPMLRGQAAASPDPAAYLQRLAAGYPQGASTRFVRPDEVAELIWFLAQDAAAPITGAAISIDFALSAGIT